MDSVNKKQCDLDFFGFLTLGIVSLGYLVLVKRLAEWNIQLPFLNFPIFFGEIVLFLCLAVFVVGHWDCRRKFTNKWQPVILCYFMFVIAKALYGYVQWGPLALRHAALFYYPVFAVFAYAFYRKGLFSKNGCLILFFLICTVLAVKHNEYWTVGLVLLGFILVKFYPQNAVKLVMVAILLVLTPYKDFFQTSRMMIVSNFLSGLYLAGTLPLILSINKKLKLALIMFMGGAVALGLYMFADRGAVKSIVAFENMRSVIDHCDQGIEANAGNFEMKKREVKLFNPDRFIRNYLSVEEEQKLRQAILMNARETISDFSPQQTGEKTQEVVEAVKREITSSLEKQLFPEQSLQVLEEAEISKPQSQETVPVEDLEAAKQEIASSLEKQLFPEQSLQVLEEAEISKPQPQERTLVEDLEAVKREITSSLEKQLSPEESPQVLEEAEIDKPQLQKTTSVEDLEATRAEMQHILLKKVQREIASFLAEKVVDKQVNAVAVDIVKNQIEGALMNEFRRKAPLVPSQKTATGWVDNNNAVFRLLIWRDMWRDLKREKPILGFSFGTPFRSKSLEILDWGTGDWARDGWIEPHNSYWHIIYRGGIIGVLFIVSVLFVLFMMIWRFLHAKSITGILLCGIIINWFVAANFLVIFELPYTAIPIWTIYGMTLAYCYKFRERV